MGRPWAFCSLIMSVGLPFVFTVWVQGSTMYGCLTGSVIDLPWVTHGSLNMGLALLTVYLTHHPWVALESPTGNVQADASPMGLLGHGSSMGRSCVN